MIMIVAIVNANVGQMFMDQWIQLMYCTIKLSIGWEIEWLDHIKDIISISKPLGS